MTTYSDVVLKLDPPGGVKLDLLQGLSDNIVRLAFALLGSLDGGSLFYVALVVDVELPEGVGEREDIALLELGVFPVPRLSDNSAIGVVLLAQTYLCSLSTFMMSRRSAVGSQNDEGLWGVCDSIYNRTRGLLGAGLSYGMPWTRDN